MSIPLPIRDIVFDVFGTITYIHEKRWPFARLLRLSFKENRRRAKDDAERIMTTAVDLAGAAALLGISIPDTDMRSLEEDLIAELASIALYPDVLPTFHQLRNAMLKITQCSDGAAP